MKQPRDVAARLEARRWVRAGTADRFAGFALLGLAFESGHILAAQRVTASAIGPPFAAVWLQAPDGYSAIHTNVDAARSWPRYLDAACTAVADDVEIRWTGPDELSVTARHARLHLALRVSATAATAALGRALALVPSRAWWRYATPLLMASSAARAAGLGELTLRGRSPSGHEYRLRPRRLWRVDAAVAVLAGVDLGAVIDPQGPVTIGDFSIPRTPLLTAAEFEIAHPALHRVSGSDGTSRTRNGDPGPPCELRNGALW